VTLHIDKSVPLLTYVEEGMQNYAMRQELRVIENDCPHCGLRMRHPLIAREWQVKALETMLNNVAKVCHESGVTGLVYADILAKCHAAIAMRKVKK